MAPPLLLLAASNSSAAMLAAPSWLYFADTKAVVGCGDTCVSSDPRFKCLGTVPSLVQCEALCRADATCRILTWSSATSNCWSRRDGVWQPVDAPGMTTGCDASRVPSCSPPPPYTDLNVSVSVGGEAGTPLHALAPAVALDFWLPTDPTYGEKWANAGVLGIDLTSAELRKYAAALAPALLRLGGSPEDSIVFDAAGTCVPGGGGQPPLPYYCSQVHPYVYGCLSPARWEAVLAFASEVGYSIAFGLNGCFGRTGADASMDFSNARAIMEATAASPHAAALAFWELSNEVVPRTISAAQWVADAAVLRNMSTAIFGARGLVAPPLVGPDQGGAAVEDVVGALAGRVGALAAITYHQYPQCTAPPTSTAFVMLPSCLAQLGEAAAGYANSSQAIAGLATWLGEGADHSGGGIPGLTDTFRSSFYYASLVGAAPLAGVELMARQCLNGGDYELLQRGSFAPNPDFWILWLAKKVLRQGARALNATSSAPALASGLQVFSFDASAASGGATALLVVNTHASNTYFLSLGGVNLAGPRVEWHVTGDVAAVHGPIAINGHVMSGDLPPIAELGARAAAGSVLVVAPASIAFVAV
jgi:heparanase 1